jgi:hypothetical protein
MRRGMMEYDSRKIYGWEQTQLCIEKRGGHDVCKLPFDKFGRIDNQSNIFCENLENCQV